MNVSNRPEPSKPSRSWYAVIIAVAIISSAVVAFYIQGGMSDLEQLERRKQQLLKENQRLNQQMEKLELRRRRLHEDPYLIEELARERLGLARPGEKTVTFRETGRDTSTRDSDPSAYRTDNPADTGPLRQQQQSEHLPFGENSMESSQGSNR